MNAVRPSPSFRNDNYLPTPVAYRDINVKPATRKLWEKETVEQKQSREICLKFGNSDTDEAYNYESPQFLDFLTLPEIGDSFFERRSVISSTPNRKCEAVLTNAFTRLSVSPVTHKISPRNTSNTSNEKNSEQYVVHKANINVEKPNVLNPLKKPRTTTVKPFSFDLRERVKRQQKQEYMNKILEQEKKAREFRANPLPKFIKSRSTLKSSTSDKCESQENVPDKNIKKNTEPWKKPPFQTNISAKMLERPKTPPLRTAFRAQERKRFDETIKQKEKLRESCKEMALALEKQREQEEIARLRKQTVHKAHPVPEYKPGLPPIKKRPLTEPYTPITLKRRRRF